MTYLKIAYTAVKAVFGKLPGWAWILILCVIVIFFVDRRARSIQKEADDKEYQARIDSMMSHPDTAYVMMPVILPKPKPAAPIAGTPLPLDPAVEKELADLRQSNMEYGAKIKAYEILVRNRSQSWTAPYQDSVQILSMFINPVKREVTPTITYKEPYCWIPVVNYTLPPKPTPWYKSSTAKTIYGIAGAGLAYAAIKNDKDQLWYAMGSVCCLSLSFGL